MKKTLQRRKWISLCLALVVLLAAALCTFQTRQMTRAGDYDVKLAAAELMQQCMDRVKAYKEELGLPIYSYDYHETGMLGDEFTGITTTLGELEAKRTTANSDMAALVVQLLTEAGVRSGDTIGAGFSGSFPSLDLAVLCACRAMGVRCVYIASVGASTYGANQPELTLPDMLYRLVQDGLVEEYPAAVTAGGGQDVGVGMMEPDTLEVILDRVRGYGLTVWSIPDFGENIQARMDLYEQEGPISCFVGVGGNITTSGRGENDLGQGLIQPDKIGLITEGSGLLERYSAQGLPVIQLLNVRRLVADYGLPFDPEKLPEAGTSAIYYETQYSRWPAAAGLLAACAILAAGFWRKKGSGRTGRGDVEQHQSDPD